MKNELHFSCATNYMEQSHEKLVFIELVQKLPIFYAPDISVLCPQQLTTVTFQLT
jgi:hypothetical protein